MAKELPRADDIRAQTEAIYANIAAMRKEMEGIGATADANAYYAERDGLVIGQGKEQLYTGANGWEAPKHHPAWSDELRRETETLRRMGEAGSQYPKPWETEPDKWPSQYMPEKHPAHIGENAATPTKIEEHTTLRRAEAGLSREAEVSKALSAEEKWIHNNRPAWERGADTERSR